MLANTPKKSTLRRGAQRGFPLAPTALRLQPTGLSGHGSNTDVTRIRQIGSVRAVPRNSPALIMPVRQGRPAQPLRPIRRMKRVDRMGWRLNTARMNRQSRRAIRAGTLRRVSRLLRLLTGCAIGNAMLDWPRAWAVPGYGLEQLGSSPSGSSPSCSLR